VARESHRLASRVTPFFSGENRAAQVLSLLGTGALFLLVSAAIALVKAVNWLVPMRHSATTAGRSRIPRVILSAFLVVVLAVSGYYIYRFPARPSGGLNTKQPEPVGTVATIRTPAPGVTAWIGDPATVSHGTVGMSTEASSDPSSSVASPIDETASQLTGGRTSTTEADTADAESQAPAQPAAASKASTDVPIAEESRSTAPQTAVQGVVPKQTVSNPSTATDTNLIAGVPRRPRATDARVGVPPDAPRPQVCTEAVATLGLCSLNTSAES
jgi:membrane protein implicated in regulation of membrane protease activity